jgi:hypothetical protein
MVVKTDCNKYILRIKLYPAFFCRGSPYVDEIIADHQCGFRGNRAGANQIFRIRQVLDKNGNTVQQYIRYLQAPRRNMILLGGNFCITFSLRLIHPRN